MKFSSFLLKLQTEVSFQRYVQRIIVADIFNAFCYEYEVCPSLSYIPISFFELSKAQLKGKLLVTGISRALESFGNNDTIFYLLRISEEASDMIVNSQ